MDSCISNSAADELRATGHDAEWAGVRPRDPGDDEILARVYSEGRVFVVLDKDRDHALRRGHVRGAAQRHRVQALRNLASKPVRAVLQRALHDARAGRTVPMRAPSVSTGSTTRTLRDLFEYGEP